jgi:hypothetical protein
VGEEVEQAVVVAAVKIIARNGPPCLTTSELLFTLFTHTLAATHASKFDSGGGDGLQSAR